MSDPKAIGSMPTVLVPTASQAPALVSDPAVKKMVEMLDKGKFDDAIQWVINKRDEENQTVSRSETFPAYPADGAYAFAQVLRLTYGWVEQKPIITFFGTKPPVVLVVKTGPGSTADVPWGDVAVPDIDGKFSIGAAFENHTWVFSIAAKVKKKDMAKVRLLMDQTREYLKTHSIYQGEAVRLEWESEKPTAFSAGNESFGEPIFMPISGLQKKDVVLPAHVQVQVNAGIFSLIENSALAKEMGVPTKRLVLAAGPYGTGKTLTATITAELCREQKRTFIYLREVEHLADAIYFAQQYAPACVFAEDIDRVTDQDDVDRISNTIDGIDTKGLDVLFVLTTNHVDRIPKKFLRSGRSDMIIGFEPPDQEAAARLVMKYGNGTLDPAFTPEDALAVAEPLAKAHMIPASIREVVERAKLYAIAEQRRVINKKDLIDSAEGVLVQCEMIKERKDEPELPSHMMKFGQIVIHKKDAVAMSLADEE